MPVVIDPPEYYLRVGDKKFWFLPTVKITEATASLREYAARIGDAPIVVTSRGKPVAALVPISGVDVDFLSLSTESDFLDLIERSRRGHRKPSTPAEANGSHTVQRGKHRLKTQTM